MGEIVAIIISLIYKGKVCNFVGVRLAIKCLSIHVLILFKVIVFWGSPTIYTLRVYRYLLIW